LLAGSVTSWAALRGMGQHGQREPKNLVESNLGWKDMTGIQDIVTLFKDLATIFAAVAAGIIAIMGYNAWKKQLRGKAEYELARRLLRNVYRVRDAIRG
jgi:hypothetical protein